MAVATSSLTDTERAVLIEVFSLQQDITAGPNLEKIRVSLTEIKTDLRLRDVGLALGLLVKKELIVKSSIGYGDDAEWRFSITERGDDYISSQDLSGQLSLETFDDDLFRITEINGYKVSEIPAADRVVSLDHNSAAYQEATEKLDNIIELVEADRSNDFEDKEQRLAELKAGRELLKSHSVSVDGVVAVLGSCLGYLARKFAEVSVGDLAGLAWTAIKNLIRNITS